MCSAAGPGPKVVAGGGNCVRPRLLLSRRNEIRSVAQGRTGNARGRRLRGSFDFAAIADRQRMPWRFLARHIAVDGLLAA